MNSQTINQKILNEAKTLMGDRFPLMIKYFIEDAQNYIREIAEGCKSKNAQRALRPAHTIKSSAAQIGAEKASDIARQMEDVCREIIDKGNEDYVELEKLYNQLKSEINIVVDELSKFSQ